MVALFKARIGLWPAVCLRMRSSIELSSVILLIVFSVATFFDKMIVKCQSCLHPCGNHTHTVCNRCAQNLSRTPAQCNAPGIFRRGGVAEQALLMIEKGMHAMYSRFPCRWYYYTTLPYVKVYSKFIPYRPPPPPLDALLSFLPFLHQYRRKRLERGGGSLIFISLTADVRCHQSLEAAAC